MALTASWVKYALDEKNVKYQPSGAGGTRSPPAMPAKSKMAARGPQNDQQGLER